VFPVKKSERWREECEKIQVMVGLVFAFVVLGVIGNPSSVIACRFAHTFVDF